MKTYYEPEVKERIVREVKETGSVVVVARRYSLPPSTIAGWLQGGNGQGHSMKPFRQRVDNLEKENQRLKKLLGEKDLEIAILQDLLKKTNQRKTIDLKWPGTGSVEGGGHESC